MQSAKLRKKIQDLYSLGDLSESLKVAQNALARKPKSAWYTTYGFVYFWTGFIYHMQGLIQEARSVFLDLIGSEQTERMIRIRSLTELAHCHLNEGEHQEARHWFGRAEELLGQSPEPGVDEEFDRTMAHHLINRSVFEFYQQEFAHAIETANRCHEFIIAIPTPDDSAKFLITNYLNLVNYHLALGNAAMAREYLQLARATMISTKALFAHGMVHFFENLATYNLFAAGSSTATIDALSEISERSVNNFAEFRRLFDFFSSIIVQLHEGKIDVEEIREQIKAYGDDPLIKAYVPTLLYGAPPPGDESGDDDIPAARLTD